MMGINLASVRLPGKAAYSDYFELEYNQGQPCEGK